MQKELKRHVLMLKNLGLLLQNDGIKARAVRGTLISITGFGSQQAIRLLANLALTRLLFPEAMGLMALAFVFISALEMFSDLGTHTAIVQSKRGDEPAFLNTAWTMQIVRGGVLWVVACLVTLPIANFYEQPALKELLPFMSFILVINGFKSTLISTANRNLQLGRMTLLEIISQSVTTFFMIAVALWWASVWALAIGTIAGAIVTVILSHVMLQGPKNKIFWEKAAFQELFYFGKFIFFSTIAGYIVLQGDRLILGKFISLEELAIYTIAIMLGGLPQALGGQISARILLPLYRKKSPLESRANYHAIGKARFLLMIGLLAIIAVFALLGVWLITFLYDPRYHAAGPILSLIALSIIPTIFLDGYSQLLLAHGDSKRYLVYIVAHAVLKIALLLVFTPQYGVLGVIFSVFVAASLAYPIVIYQIRSYRGWYPLSDVMLLGIGLGILMVTFWASPDVLFAVTSQFGS